MKFEKSLYVQMVLLFFIILLNGCFTKIPHSNKKISIINNKSSLSIDDVFEFYQKIEPSDVRIKTFNHVTINGDFAIVIAELQRASFSSNKDTIVYFYKYSGSQWEYNQTLYSSNIPPGKALSVAISGTTAAIGNPHTEKVYVYKYILNEQSGKHLWVEDTTLEGNPTLEGINSSYWIYSLDGYLPYENYGINISISNDLIIVGNQPFREKRVDNVYYGRLCYQPSSYIYRKILNKWVLEAKFNGDQYYSYYPAIVDISGNYAVMGYGDTFKHKVTIFHFDGNSWNIVKEIKKDYNSTISDVSLFENMLLIIESKQAYILKLNGDSWENVATINGEYSSGVMSEDYLIFKKLNNSIKIYRYNNQVWEETTITTFPRTIISDISIHNNRMIIGERTPSYPYSPSLSVYHFISMTRDGDNDSITDINDNCPDIKNTNQNDLDNDGSGDACDTVDDRFEAIAIHDWENWGPNIFVVGSCEKNNNYVLCGLDYSLNNIGKKPSYIGNYEIHFNKEIKLTSTPVLKFYKDCNLVNTYTPSNGKAYSEDYSLFISYVFESYIYNCDYFDVTIENNRPGIFPLRIAVNNPPLYKVECP